MTVSGHPVTLCARRVLRYAPSRRPRRSCSRARSRSAPSRFRRGGGRPISAEAATAAVDLPPFASSAMDGFAIRAGGCAGSPRGRRPCGGRQSGRPGAPAPVRRSRSRRAVSSPTVPDAVIPLEYVVQHDNTIEIAEGVAAGAHVRRARRRRCDWAMRSWRPASGSELHRSAHSPRPGSPGSRALVARASRCSRRVASSSRVGTPLGRGQDLRVERADARGRARRRRRPT